MSDESRIAPELAIGKAQEKIREEAEHARKLAYTRLVDIVLARYVDLFPNYVWTDPITAVDLMAAEIKTLRAELNAARERGGERD